MKQPLFILLLENSLDDARLIEYTLKKENISFDSRVVDTKEEFEEYLIEFRPDVIISGHSLPDFNSQQAFKLYNEYKNIHHLASIFILVTEDASEEMALTVMKEGADDYVFKDRLKRLPLAILNAQEKNKSQKERIQAEEEKLQVIEIFQKSLHEIYVLSPDTLRFMYMNNQACKNIGYTRDEIKEMTPADIIYDFDEERFRRIMDVVAKSEKGMIYERYAIRKDGTKYPIQIHMEVIEYGDEIRFLANVLDITENKKHQSQKRLAHFIQDCFNEKRTLQESLQLVSEELGNQSGMDAVEIWTTHSDFAHMKCYGRWKKPGTPAPQAGKVMATTVFRTGIQSSLRDMKKEQIKECAYDNVLAYPIKSGGKVTAVISFFAEVETSGRDPLLDLREGVQDKLASNIKRKKTEEELQKIFKYSPDILAIIGKDGYVRKINPALDKILGYSQEEMLSRSYDDLIHPKDEQIFLEWKNKDIKEGDVAHYESRWRAKNGEYKSFAWSITPYLEGELYFAIGKDITEYKKHLRAIEKQNQKLAEIAWEQSHTVRAPLSRLLSCVAFLEEHEDKDHPLLQSIKETAFELDEIVKSIVMKTEKL